MKHPDLGTTYLYRCWDRYGHLIYVGITDDVERRKRQHSKDKHWWPDVDRVTVMTFERRIEALWAEWAVITTCSPTYNKSAGLPITPDEQFVERIELMLIDRDESLFSVLRRWWHRWDKPAEIAVVVPVVEPAHKISTTVRGSHLYEPKPLTPAPQPNPAPIVPASFYLARAEAAASPPVVELEPASEFDAIVADFDPKSPARELYYEILREVGEVGIGGTEMERRLQAEGHRTVRQTIHDWFVEDFGYLRVLKVDGGRYRWNPDQP